MQPVDLSALPPSAAFDTGQTLAGAVDAARELGVSDAPWLTAARDAYCASFAACAFVALLALLALSFSANRVYRKEPPRPVEGH